MSIKLTQLDGSYAGGDNEDNDVEIILGSDILLEVIPRKSIIHSYQPLKDFIETKDLLKSKNVNYVGELVEYSELLRDRLAHHVVTQEGYKSRKERYKDQENKTTEGSEKEFYSRRHKRTEEASKELLEENYNDLIEISGKIKRIENEFAPLLSTTSNHYFCKNCYWFVGDEKIPPFCANCESIININDLDKNLISASFTFLSGKVASYLEGKWFEDYIAKILKKADWEPRCHSLTVGVSGERHPVDVLAAHRKKIRVLIIECKISNSSFGAKDILSFIARWNDIKCDAGIFVVMNKCAGLPPCHKLIRRTPGLTFLDDLYGFSDKEIFVKINKAIQGVTGDAESESEDEKKEGVDKMHEAEENI